MAGEIIHKNFLMVMRRGPGLCNVIQVRGVKKGVRLNHSKLKHRVHTLVRKLRPQTRG